MRPHLHELPRVVSSLVPKGPQLCLCRLGLVPSQRPGPSHRLSDMPLSSRTQPRPSPHAPEQPLLPACHSGLALVGTGPAPGPGQVQTARLAPRSRSNGAGRMPTALVTTDRRLHAVEGPRQRDSGWEFRTQQKAISLPHWEPGVGILEANDRRSRLQKRVKETGRMGRTGAKEMEWRVKGWCQVVTDLLPV